MLSHNKLSQVWDFLPKDRVLSHLVTNDRFVVTKPEGKFIAVQSN